MGSSQAQFNWIFTGWLHAKRHQRGTQRSKPCSVWNSWRWHHAASVTKTGKWMVKTSWTLLWEGKGPANGGDFSLSHSHTHTHTHTHTQAHTLTNPLSQIHCSLIHSYTADLLYEWRRVQNAETHTHSPLTILTLCKYSKGIGGWEGSFNDYGWCLQVSVHFNPVILPWFDEIHFKSSTVFWYLMAHLKETPHHGLSYAWWGSPDSLTRFWRLSPRNVCSSFPVFGFLLTFIWINYIIHTFTIVHLQTHIWQCRNAFDD